jgi:hypothetical protein
LHCLSKACFRLVKVLVKVTSQRCGTRTVTEIRKLKSASGASWPPHFCGQTILDVREHVFRHRCQNGPVNKNLIKQAYRK